MEEAGAEVVLMSEEGRRPEKFTALALALFAGFKKTLKEVRPDIVHVQYMAPGSLSILLFRLLGVKNIIATAHTPGHIYRRRWIPQLIARHLTRSFLCVSRSSEEAFFGEGAALFSKELYARGRKHFTLYNCVEIPSPTAEKIATKPSKPKTGKPKFTLGIVSRLSREKGVDIMLAALPAVLERYPDTELLIVGDGAERERLLAQAETLGISHAITWVGLQPRERLAGYYAQMDLVVVPSRFEGFGLTAIEAMARGIPVVAAAVDGLREVIEEGVSGRLFAPEDPEALAAILLELLEDDPRREALGTAGVRRVEEHFGYTRYREAILDLYRTVGEEGE
jgi:glycosyltransferase involved in cell wall biosynthesis